MRQAGHQNQYGGRGDQHYAENSNNGRYRDSDQPSNEKAMRSRSGGD